MTAVVGARAGPRAASSCPGASTIPPSAGCLAFLREFRDGTRIVAGIPQLIEDLGLAVRPDAPRATALAGATLTELGGDDRRVGEALVAGHVTVDELVAVTGFPVATVLGLAHAPRAPRPRSRRLRPVPPRGHARARGSGRPTLASEVRTACAPAPRACAGTSADRTRPV